MPKLHEVIPWARIPGVFTALHLLNVWIYKQYPLVLTASSNTEEQLNSWGVSNTLQHRLLGVELDKFTPPDSLVPKDELRIITVTRFDPDKNINWLVSIVRKIIAQGIRCSFTFVGSGLEIEEVKALSEQYDNIIFVGSVSNQETVAYYQQADVFITAATHETFGTTLLEAASCGLALVGYRDGAVCDRIEHESNGFLVETENENEFVDRIAQLANDHALTERYKARSVEVAASYGNEQTSDNLLGIWQENIQSRTHAK